MKKGFAYRKITHYGRQEDPSIEVKIAVYGHGHLTDPEIQTAIDEATDKIMLALTEVPLLHVRLSKIKAIRTGQF